MEYLCYFPDRLFGCHSLCQIVFVQTYKYYSLTFSPAFFLSG